MSAESTDARHVYVVVPRGSVWDVKEEESGEAVATALQREEAIDVARGLAEASPFGHIVVHGPDGLFEYESTCAKRVNRPKRHAHV